MAKPPLLARVSAAVRAALPALRGQQFAAPRSMTSDIAGIEYFMGVMMSAPDPDEVLKRAGIGRADLRVIETDDEVSAALDTRREALIGTPWRLEGGTQRWRNELQAELAPHMDALLRGAFQAVPYGYSVVEVVYENRPDGRVGIARLAEKPFEWFEPRHDGQLLYHDAQRGGTPWPVDLRKFLLTVRNASWRNPRGEALLSRAWWPWYARNQGMKYWMRWMERYGTPLMVGKTDSIDVQALAEKLAAAVNSAAIAIGKNDDVMAVAPGSSGAGHFETFDASICRRFQKLILGQTLTTDASSGGSYAAAKVADGVRMDRRNADIRMCSATVQRLVDTLWAFAGRAGDPPRFVMADDTGLEAERAKRDAILVEKVGVRLSEEYIAERYDLELGEFTMTDPTARGQDAGQDSQEGAGGPNEGDDGPRQPGARFSAARKLEFTPVQQGIEDGLARLQTVEPIPPELVRAAVLAASDEADLRARLAALIPQADPRFQQALERASYAAAVLGYVAADELRS